MTASTFRPATTVFTLAAVAFFFVATVAPSAQAQSRRQAVPPAPEIIAPEKIAEFRGVETVEVSWDYVSGADRYHVVLARDRAFKKVVENRRIDETSFTFTNLEVGTYFVRVRAVNSQGRGGPYSETRAFLVAPPPPTTIIGPVPKSP